ncbi:MAG: altronate dehydratase [Planctomycetota bacterium]|jgi:altronate dehydratase
MMRLEDCSRLPANGDNVAIAVRRIDAGTVIEHAALRFEMAHTVLEGHRFVFESIANGQPLLSWGLPFGDATRELVPGDYLCNERILRALSERDIDFELPGQPNFVDRFEPCELDLASIVPGQQVAPVELPGTFDGYLRDGNRGVGTRNFLVVLALTSADAALATAVAERARQTRGSHPGSGAAVTCEVVAVTHTEGGGKKRPHNLDFVLRTLSGFVVHANTGAVLVIDHGNGSFTNRDLETFLRAEGYALDSVPHQMLTVLGSFQDALAQSMAAVAELLPVAVRAKRSQQPLSGLRLALQCGGSDAFSGVSGNSLAGWVAKELIRHGGGANLAETDELIGAESYVLANVRDRDVAVRFLDKVATFKERAERHGASAEGNPSGGNNYRGLYNIALKSLGAARKKDPDVRLDHVLDYGAPMHEGGYYFMDSPGNDLESIAGQVASGCNLILFITGNGSITNFPFVPTLKFVTTTGRFELMSNEMDVNAGRYNDGMSMPDLGAETFDLVRRVASGERSKGEAAGHSQVSIWREWRQQDASQLQQLQSQPTPTGVPLPAVAAQPAQITFDAFATERGITSERIALVMPTSLCSGQVAELIAAELNSRGGPRGGLSRFVALAHTEGCGAANSEELYLQTMVGHLRHPFTQRALLLEHGCEKTHNDAVRHWFGEHGEEADDFGFASVQLDGGIEKVRERVVAWFTKSLSEMPEAKPVVASGEHVRLAVMSSGSIDDVAQRALASVCAGILAAGGTVVLPDNDGLLACDGFRSALLAHPDAWQPSLAYGQAAKTAGLHIMRTPTEDASETVTGLGGTGVELMIAGVGCSVLQGHPMIPMLQVSADLDMARRYEHDLDVILAADADQAVQALLHCITETLSRRYQPKLTSSGNVRFQLTRGDLGVSL